MPSRRTTGHAARPEHVRPFVAIEEMARFMTEDDLVSAPVTTSDGRLVGLLLRRDIVGESSPA
ncbi:MAG TPA: CBS domain-containing protein [Terriglobales bacterium]|nr:CBS domain-containing protein [Terriglobales bacterium]